MSKIIVRGARILGGEPQDVLIDGETISASIEGIGTLTHTVRVEQSVPDDLSGSQLPPVSSYRP